MNLDLLKKLVRLANNNPNENEANLATRKVCKIIEEGKFNFNSNGNESTKQTNYSKRDPMVDWMGDILRHGQYYDNRQSPPVYAKWEPPKQEPRPEKKMRTCVKCNKTVETVRICNIFICNECEWREYQKTKGEW